MVFLRGIRDLPRWVLLKKASADLQQSLHASTFSTLRAKMQAALLDFGKASGMIGSEHSIESSQPFQSLLNFHILTFHLSIHFLNLDSPSAS